MGHVGKTVTQNVVSGSEITDGTVTGADLASDIAISTSGATALTNKLTVLASDGTVDNDWVMDVRNDEATDDRSYGLRVSAGSTSTDRALDILDHAQANTLLRVNGAGHVTMPSQPCFLVRNSSDQSNLTTNGGLITVVFDTEVFDQNADFASNTFTAPVTGRYLFTYNVNLAQVDADHTILALTLSTSNNAFTNNPIVSPTSFDADMGELALNGAIICDMDANDTALVRIAMEGGLSQTDIKANGVRTNFGGVLLC